MKIVSRFLSFISTILVIAVVLLAVMLVGVRVIGFTPYAVLSGSMEPVYHVGSLIYVKSSQAEDIEVGDPITFVLNDDLVVATHRVIEIDAENEYFYTKGDANDSPDSAPVHFKNLLGKPIFTIPYLGYLSNWLQTRQGMIIAITALVVIVILAFIPDLIKSLDKKEASKAKENNQKN